SDELVSKLIKLRYERREEFRAAGKSSTTRGVWAKVVQDLGMEDKVSASQARKKWHNLVHRFREIESKTAGGSTEDHTWPHYNQMQAIMKELTVYENPSILATGNDNEPVKIQFADSYANDSLSNDEEILDSRPTKQDRQEHLDERFINAIEEGNQQLKAMQKTLERQGETFLQLMSRIVDIMENQSNDDMSM
ncbi:uncharacterized protein LOC118201143, partial [Stegodyphus dumicola]|uniref:uncharacterized protein LOC118201143 n=1 Tax=Stegodyphus dumicola TaxID=202533 RepID=UPI0015B06BE5